MRIAQKNDAVSEKFSISHHREYCKKRYSLSLARRRVRDTVERFNPSCSAIWGMVIPWS